MNRKITCVNCGKSTEINYTSNQDIIDSGFDYVFDISNGLSNIIICNNCADKIKIHVKAIEGMLKTEIDNVHLGSMSSYKN